MPSKRPSSHPGTTQKEPPRSKPDVDIDDASLDETASVEADEDLVELSNPDDDQPQDDESSPAKGAWRDRDANRRAHGSDDLKA
jgi:hypothetical protein